MNEVHRKVSMFLTKKYKVIMLPSFETSNMVKKGPKRKIGSKTARMMMTF